MRMMRWLAAALTIFLMAPLAAQVMTPPDHPAQDANGVDLVKGSFSLSTNDVSIGPSGKHGLSFKRRWNGGGWDDTFARLAGGSGDYVAVLDGVSSKFSSYATQASDGSQLIAISGGFKFIAKDGTEVIFSSIPSNYYTDDAYSVTSIRYPDGTLLSFYYDISTSYAFAYPRTLSRVKSIQSNFNYQIKIEYISDDISSNYYGWSMITAATAINTAIEACDPNATHCSLSHAWPKATYDYGNAYWPTDVHDPAGRVTHYGYNYDYCLQCVMTSVRRPSASSDDVSISYGSYSGYGGDQVSSVVKAGVTWNYNYNYFLDSSYIYRLILTVTGPNGAKRQVGSNQYSLLVDDDIDGVGQGTHLDHDGSGRVTKVTAPEGNSIEYTYDGRGNVTATTLHAKPGSGLADISTTANYVATCVDWRTCNLPVWTKDAKGAQTDYEYHWIGQIAKITLPADANGVRAQTRYDYANPDGTNSSTGLWLVGLVRQCRTANLDACAGGSDEIVTDIAFGANWQNYLPQWTRGRAGDSSVTATTSFTYDENSNVASTTDPNGNTNYAWYNPDRQVTWTLSADPDGGGAMKRRAVAYLYKPDGAVEWRIDGTADLGLANWAELQRLHFDYDGYGRKVSQTLQSAGSASSYAMTQFNYDNEGRLYCTAVRMNPATWGSLPYGCDQATEGSDGKDRISKIDYDGADHVIREWSGFASPEQNNVFSMYTPNGKLAYIKDEKGSPTAYSYDGFDRPAQTCYNTTTCSGAGDYDQLYNYDANGNASNRRMRDGNVWSYQFDALNRVVQAAPPALDWTDKTVNYSWDNADHMVQALDVTHGHNVTRGYDALGRMIYEQNPWRRKDFGYDAGGRMTSINYGDAFSLTYTYYATDEMSQIYENGSTMLINYGYDDLGQLTYMGRANGTSTNYGFDPGSRLTGLTQNMGGSSVIYGYGHNSAGQITSRTSSNDAYSWTAAANVNRNYSADGLNRYAAIDGVSPNPTYDARGNMTRAGGATYNYTAANQLAGGNGTWLYYDAIGRLDIDAAGCQLFDYADSQMTEELDCSNAATLRRYVYGAEEAPVLWYEGSGLSDKRYLHTDERGSVIALSNGSGALIQANAYDEYGIPQPSNMGRFQYTGQAWLPTIQMYSYKARIYSPTLGRFMQTDPIGYGDGMNWYNYTGSDPINFTDPTGTDSCPPECPRGTDNNGPYKGQTIEFRPGGTSVEGGKYTPDGKGGFNFVQNYGGTVDVGGGSGMSSEGATGGAQNAISKVLNHDIGADIVVLAKKVPKPIQNFVSSWFINYDCAFVSRSSCSLSDYLAAGGMVAGAEFGILGRELKLGKNFRVAPMGNRTRSTGQLPHYHRRGVGPDGNTTPGQGIGRHRPWDSKSTDQSFWDRF